MGETTLEGGLERTCCWITYLGEACQDDMLDMCCYT